MTIYDRYGTSNHTPTELAQLVTGQLDLTFVEHDSYYRGTYLAAEAASHRIEIQPNAIPGDGEEDDLYDPEHPEMQTLLLVTGPDRDSTLTAHLDSVDALMLLARNMS